jgi:hypothetical protein
MGGFLGKIALLAPRSSYPLGFHHAAQITAERLALVGDAAHAIHPIAGQGLNLGFRDAAALAQVLVEGARLGLDLGDKQLLDRYQRWRSLDALIGRFATDSLTRIYGVPGKTASAVRRFGMGLVGPHLAAQEPADERSARHQRRAAAAARACRSNYWSVGSISTPPDRRALELHQLDQQVGAAVERRLLEQRLLGADVERRDLGDGIDQHFVVEPADRFPVDRQPERIAEPPRFALDLGALASDSGGGSLSSNARCRRRRSGRRASVGLGDQPEAVRASRTMLKRPSSSSSTPTISPTQPTRRAAPVVVVHPVRLDHADPPGPSIASRTISR